jgi:4'-phosphopantetheinyl transferase
MATAPAGNDFEAPTAPSQAPSWNEDTLHLWNVPLDLPDDIHELLVACLTTDERARCERLRFARDRRRFAASRGALRQLIGSYLRLPPTAVWLRYGPHEKPYLCGRDGPTVQFNLAHSDALAIVALTQRRAVGVDVERIRSEFVSDRLAAAIMSPAEIIRFRALASEKRAPAFFSIWTRKEAYLKARGLGLSLRPDGIDIAGSADLDLPAPRGWSAPLRLGGWDLHAFTPAEGYAGAVAVATSEGPTDQSTDQREGAGPSGPWCADVTPTLHRVARLDIVRLGVVAPGGRDLR